jgi:CBS domain-containing protein
MQTKLSAVLEHKGPEVHGVAPTASVLDAVRAMNEARVGALLVRDNEQVVGIFTERDVLCRVVDQGLDPAAIPVAQVMTCDVITLRPDATVEEAMGVISEKRCRHLPVLEGDQLKGLLSIGDLTRWVTRKQAFHIQDLVNYITGKYPV